MRETQALFDALALHHRGDQARAIDGDTGDRGEGAEQRLVVGREHSALSLVEKLDHPEEPAIAGEQGGAEDVARAESGLPVELRIEPRIGVRIGHVQQVERLRHVAGNAHSSVEVHGIPRDLSRKMTAQDAQFLVMHEDGAALRFHDFGGFVQDDSID